MTLQLPTVKAKQGIYFESNVCPAVEPLSPPLIEQRGDFCANVVNSSTSNSTFAICDAWNRWQQQRVDHPGQGLCTVSFDKGHVMTGWLQRSIVGFSQSAKAPIWVVRLFVCLRPMLFFSCSNATFCDLVGVYWLKWRTIYPAPRNSGDAHATNICLRRLVQLVVVHQIAL